MYKTLKIYYDKLTGEVIWSVFYSETIEVDFEHDYEVIWHLKERIKESIGLLVLENNQYAQDFAECIGYRVNPETKELEFSYPDPNAPKEPQPYQAPLSVEVEELKQRATIQDTVIEEIMFSIIPEIMGGGL